MGKRSISSIKSCTLRENEAAPPHPVMLGREQENDLRVSQANANRMLAVYRERAQQVKESLKKITNVLISDRGQASCYLSP